MTSLQCHQCGAPLPPGATFCGGCGTPVALNTPTTPPPGALQSNVPTSPPPPGVPMAQTVAAGQAAPSNNRSGYIALAVIALIALGGMLFIVTKGDDSGSTTAGTKVDRTTVAPVTSVDLVEGEVLLEPVGASTPDPFTDSVTDGVEAAPAVPLPSIPIPTTTAPLPDDQVALPQVAGREPGLYGGTRDVAACDKEALITFLEANADKAAAWAGVQGINPADIRSYITALTPLVLTRDTRVTNHGFRNGAARPHQSVLQAGHAVLVDEFGVPRAKCSCGNPLAPPVPLSKPPTYIGTQWTGFDPTTIIVVVATDPVDAGFVIVDLGDGTLILRPRGFQTGQTDLQADVELVNVGNIIGIVPGAQAAPSFTVSATTLVTLMLTYHYDSSAPAGQVGLQSADGSFYGPFPTVGSDELGGAGNAIWTATPMVVVPAGTYTVWDSDPATWSTSEQTGGVGFAIVRGVVGVNQAPSAPGTPPAGTGTAATSYDRAALQIIDQLLLDCGYNITEWTDNGEVDNGWNWIASAPAGPADFFVYDPLGNWSVGVNNQVAADLAVECGFYQP